MKSKRMIIRGSHGSSHSSQDVTPASNAPSTSPRLKTGEAAGGQLRRTLNRVISRETSHLISIISSAGIVGTLRPIIIEVIDVAPDPLIENRPARIEFLLANITGDDVTAAFVRVRVAPKHSLNEYEGLFQFPVPSLPRGQSIYGAVSFTAPRADLGNTFTLELCRWGDVPPGVEFPPLIVLASASQEFDVGARFSIGMYGIVIRDTASHHNDTLMVSFGGQTIDQTWSDVAYLGDQNNTPARQKLDPKVAPVGTVDFLPGSGTGLSISFVIANAGHTSNEEDARKVGDAISKVGGVIATTIMSILFPVGAGVWAGLSAAADALNEFIIDYLFADCDTVVLADGKLITEADLFAYTFDPNDAVSFVVPAQWLTREQKKAGEKLVDILGGGCRDSDYSVNFSLTRFRAPEMVHTQDGFQLNYGQEINFGATGPGIAFIDYEVVGNGNPGKVDLTGMYRAPLDSTDRKYDVIEWTVFRDTTAGRKPWYKDFAIVLLD
jgi:hypothetical protein